MGSRTQLRDKPWSKRQKALYPGLSKPLMKEWASKHKGLLFMLSILLTYRLFEALGKDSVGAEV